MDIWLAYNCLLGRPWIHDTRVVPSSLHQKATFNPQNHPSPATIEENETRSGLKNQRRSGKIVEGQLSSSGGIPLVGGQHRTSPQEGWKSADVDLNRASPKDNFLLPHIDLLVDNTTQHSYYSFMDRFSGYNQI
ncbi:hypothetical protein CR513_23474, partial [Mucuna pruriens]